MGSQVEIYSSKGRVPYEDVGSYTNNFAIGGKATGYGSASFGIPVMPDGKSFQAGAPGPVASAAGAFAQGIVTEASAMGAMATGDSTKASGKCSFTAGKETQATADYAFAAGKGFQATAEAAIALGQDVTADEAGSVVVGGPAGKPFKVSNGSDLFTVDNQGNGEFLKNLKVNEASEIGKTLKVGRELTVGAGGKFSGTVVASDFVTGGGDYAEFFEWDDDNPQEEDRRYRFVGLNEDRIYLINDPADWILGIISVNPSILGDAGGGKMTDPRYAKVGLLGKLILEDDGTCQPNHWCKPLKGFNGIGTQSDEPTRFRVMKRLDENHIRVLILG